MAESPEDGLVRKIPAFTGGHLRHETGASLQKRWWVILSVGISRGDLLDSFEAVEWVATHHHEYAVPEERNVPICVCRGPKRPIGELWPFLEGFI